VGCSAAVVGADVEVVAPEEQAANAILNNRKAARALYTFLDIPFLLKPS
jgi:hypothetical protein